MRLSPFRSTLLSVMPHNLPTGGHLQKLWADALVRRRPLAGLVRFCRCLILRQNSGTRASRADQGSAPLDIRRIRRLFGVHFLDVELSAFCVADVAALAVLHAAVVAGAGSI